MSVFQQPTPEQLAAFVEGDPVAIDEVVQLILPPIARWAIAQYPNLPEQEVESVLNQVLAEVCIQPERYNPSGGAQLTTYVIHLLRLRMNDAWEKQSGVQENEIYGSEAHEKLIQMPYNEIENITTSSAREVFFEQVAERLTPVEREFLALWRTGEIKTEAFAEILQKYINVSDAAKEVKNMKERLGRKLKAFAGEAQIDFHDLIE
jgi:hypothetical protein